MNETLPVSEQAMDQTDGRRILLHQAGCGVVTELCHICHPQPDNVEIFHNWDS